MESLSTPCVFCGIDRPLASEACPSCGRGWIDARVADLAAPDTSLPASGGDAGGEDETPRAPVFSDANNTGFDEGFEQDDAEEAPPAESDAAAELEATAALAATLPAGAAPATEPTPESPHPEANAGDAREDVEATSVFAAAPEAADDSAPAGDDAPPAAPIADATEPIGTEEPTDAAAPGPDEGLASSELEPVAPDELGVFPAITAAGPPQYLPEPEQAPAPTAYPAPDASAPIEAAEPPETAEKPAAVDDRAAEERDVIPLVPPPSPEPPAVEPEPGVESASPAAEEGPTPDDTAADESTAPEKTPASPAAIDPDGLISDVFADDLVDGRPPAASDALLDDADAWSDFAAGSVAAAAAPAPQTAAPSPAAPPPVRSEPPEPDPSGSFPGDDPEASPFFAGAPDTRRQRDSDGGGSDGPSRPRRWSQTAIVALIVLGIIGAWFIVLALITSGEDEAPTAGGDDPVATAVTSSSSADATTTAPSTSSTTTTSTTTTTTTLASIEPVGDAIAIADLGLGAFALGPLEFPAADGLGRLVATFDQPDAVAEASEGMGLCADDAGFTAQWDSFTGIFIGAPETNVLVGYRLDEGAGDPYASLTTLSGLQLGDTIETLEATYAGFEISYEEMEGQTHFILVRQSDATTLLWGPVSSEEPDGVVQGIYSPLPCDGGPAPSS